MKKNANNGPKTPVSAPSKPTPAASKSASAPAPASKPVKKVAAPKASTPKAKTVPSQAPAPTASVPVAPKTMPVPKAVPVAPKVAPAAPNVVPAIKAPTPETVAVTTIGARIDVGFGNGLYIRGEGAGLNWDKGILLENITADRWQIVLQGVTTPVVFKFLLNDETWSLGEDYVITPGSTLLLEPSF